MNIRLALGLGAVSLVVVIVGVVLLFRFVGTRGADEAFGDQRIKTTVALLELHHTRYGTYPASLSDLKFVGQWDRMFLNGVAYTPAPDRRSYHVEVRTGWIGKPGLDLPDEFWQGTGYRPALGEGGGG